MDMIQPTLLTIEDLIAQTQWSRNTIDRYVKQGKFPRPIKVGRSNRWSVADFEAWLANNTKVNAA
jgi:prophage regulatory protein